MSERIQRRKGTTSLEAALKEAQEKAGVESVSAPQEKRVAKKKVAPKAAPRAAKPKIDKPGFYTGTYARSLSTPPQEARLPRDLVRNFDGRGEVSTAADEALGNLTERYIAQAHDESVQAYEKPLRGHAKAMEVIAEEQLDEIATERKSKKDAERAQQVAVSQGKRAEALAKLQAGAATRKAQRTLRTTMDRGERDAARAHLAAQEATQKVNKKKESRESEPVTDAEFEEVARDYATEHAATEAEPNSPKETKAKLDALLTKFGPNTAFNTAPGSTPEKESMVTPEVPQAPQFEVGNLDINFKLTRPEVQREAPHFSSSKSTILEGGSFAFGGNGGPTTSGYEGEPHHPVPAPQGPREVILAGEQVTEEIARAEEIRAGKRDAKLDSNAGFRKGNETLLAEEKQRQEFYFAALRRSQKTRGFWDALGERSGFGKARNDDPVGQVAALRRGWVEQRAERAKYMLDSIDARRAGRGGAARQSRDIEKVRARYQRMFVIKEAVLGAEEAEQKVRIDALRSRDKNVVEAVWKNYNKLSPRQKQLFGVATAATAGTTAAVFGGVPALLTVLAMSGAGAALNTVSLMSKEGSKTQKFASNASKFVTFGGFGGMLGRMFARGANKQKLSAAEQKLGERKYTDLRSAAAFGNLSNERKNAAQDKDRVGNRVTTVGAASALAASAAGGALVGGAFDKFGHGSAGSTHGEHGSEGATGGTSGHGAEVEHNGHEISARIDERGEGADKLYADLREKISEAYRRSGDRPPVVEKIFEFKNMDEFSRATGFETIVKGADVHAASSHIDSAVMHMEGDGFKADTFTLSADAKTLTYIDSKGVSHVLMQETPQHEVVVQSQQEGWIPMRNYGPHSEVGRAPAGALEAKPTLGDAVGDAKIADLNRAQQSGAIGTGAPAEPAPNTSERLYRTLDELPDRTTT